MSEVAQAVTAPPTPTATPGVPGQSATAAAQQAVTPTPGAPPAAPDLLELDVNGQLRKYTKEEIRNKILLGDGAHAKFQEAAQIRKQQEEWKQRVQKDAIAALMDPALGLSKEQIKAKFESWYKENFIDPEMMTKEQREAAEWKKKAETLEQKQKDDEEKAQQTAQQQLDQQTRQSVQQEIIQVLETSNLPKTRFTANRVAFWMKQNLKNGYNAAPEVIIQQVKDERNSIIGSLVETASPEQLVDMLGEQVIKKLRQFDMGRLKAKFQPQQNGALPTQNTNGTTSAKKSAGGKSMRDVDQYFNELRRSKK